MNNLEDLKIIELIAKDIAFKFLYKNYFIFIRLLSRLWVVEEEINLITAWFYSVITGIIILKRN